MQAFFARALHANVRSAKIPIPIETRSLPALARSYPRHFTLITRTAPCSAPATLAALPSTRAIPDRDVFYVADPISSIASRPHCKHLPEMTPGFAAGLVIPDLWQQEAMRALQPPHLTILVSRGTTSYGA